MHNIWLIIRREYLERVRSKAFLIFTILVMPRGIVGTLYAWRSKRGA